MSRATIQSNRFTPKKPAEADVWQAVKRIEIVAQQIHNEHKELRDTLNTLKIQIQQASNLLVKLIREREDQRITANQYVKSHITNK